MKLKFDPGQSYQIEAVNSITDLFNGQPADQGLLSTSFQGFLELFGMVQTERGYGNRLILTEERIQENIDLVQERNLLERTLVKENGLNFSIEMETGTGKTYVYLRTILELSIKYGWKKFIIVVPSIAIRAGTMKSLSITYEHFRNLYNAIPYEYFEYSSSNLARVRSFATSNTVQIMVINIQSFRRESNIINTESDKMDGAAPMEFISSARPVVIIDEPQSVDSTEGARTAIQGLNPLFILRYSATHKDIYNLMYRYDPVRAFQENRVKQICVISTTAEGTSNIPYIQAAMIDNKKGIKARIRIQVDGAGSIGEKSINLKGGKVYDLFELSGEKDGYQGWVIPADGIWAEPGNEYLKFTNGTKLKLHEEIGGMTGEMQRIQIHATVQRHLEQELILQPRGIKVLSLFFVDKVANYRYWEEGANDAVLGKFGQWFEEAYEEFRKQPRYAKLALAPVKEVHNGYFAEDNKHHYTDTGGENLKLDTVAYELIMEQKEELLDPAVPLRFIFSHSALREGWDNPNVFQICALRDMATVRQRRQTIGRGLRIAVNSEGERIFDKGLNKLYVIANESYAQFAKGLQEEYETDANVSFGKIPPVAFARLLVVTPAGTEQPLGRNGSEAVWQSLSENGLVDSTGRLTGKFQPGKPGFSLQLPKEYAPIAADILTVLKSYQIEQHITKGDPRQVKLHREVITENRDFKALWDRIKQKTTYEVKFSSGDLIREAAKSIRTASAITAATVFIDVAALQVKQGGINASILNQGSEQIKYSGRLPDIITYLQKETELTRATIVNILRESGRLADFIVNPQAFMVLALHHIRHTLGHLLVDGIKYRKVEEEFSLRLFEELDRKYISQLTNSMQVKKSLVDYIEFESEPEKRFAAALEKRDDIRFFIKLPDKFKIDTPVGTYNPDWAIVTTDDRLVYMVRETKSTRDFFKLRNTEVDKVRCGAKHFYAIGQVDFGVVTEADEIYHPDKPN